jgi:hypothetical protein
MRVLRSSLAIAVAFGALAGGAAATTVQLNWHEQAKVRAKPAIAFHVQALVSQTKGKVSGWAVVAAVTNTSTKPLRISARQFGLALFENSSSTDPRQAKLLPAGAFSPALPATLAPGKTWRGTFIGVGKPTKGSYVRVLFGWFSGPAVGGTGFNWISDHVHRWCPGSCSTYGA